MTSDIYYYGFYNESFSFTPVHRESLVCALCNHSRFIAVLSNDIQNFVTSVVHYECLLTGKTQRITIFFIARVYKYLHRFSAAYFEY